MASAFATLDAAIKTALDGLSWTSGVIGAMQGEAFAAPRGTHWRAEILYPADGGSMSVAGSGVTGNAVRGTLRVKIKGAPIGDALATVKTEADVVRSYFSRRLVSTAYFFAPSGPRSEPETNWDVVVVDCPFEVREA